MKMHSEQDTAAVSSAVRVQENAGRGRSVHDLLVSNV
jgi:hypothetical protein